MCLLCSSSCRKDNTSRVFIPYCTPVGEGRPFKGCRSIWVPFLRVRKHALWLLSHQVRHRCCRCPALRTEDVESSPPHSLVFVELVGTRRGPDASDVRPLRVVPSGEKWLTPQYTVPISPLCPQGGILATLPPHELQGAVVPGEYISHHPPRNIGALGCCDAI